MKDLRKHLVQFAKKLNPDVEHYEVTDNNNKRIGKFGEHSMGWTNKDSHHLELMNHLTKHGYNVSDSHVNTKHALHQDGPEKGETHIFKVSKGPDHMYVTHSSDSGSHSDDPNDRFHSIDTSHTKPSVPGLKKIKSFGEFVRSDPRMHAIVKSALDTASNADTVPPKNKLN